MSEQATAGQEVTINESSDLSFAVADEPGTLANALKVLKSKILAISGVGSGALGTVHIVPQNVDEAQNQLEQAGFRVVRQHALIVRLYNGPNVLANLAERLGRRDINIQAIYGSTFLSYDWVVVSTNDPKGAYAEVQKFLNEYLNRAVAV